MTELIKRFSFRMWMVIMIVVIVVTMFTMYVFNEQRAIRDAEVRAARNLIRMAESVRENMTIKWNLGLFSTEALREIQQTEPNAELRKDKILSAVPVVAAWKSAKAKAQEGGFEFRTPRHGARNKNNEPDAIEAEALAYFKSNPEAAEHVLIDNENNAIRYFRPVRLSEVCMNCHGDPANSNRLWGTLDGTDITGFKMDNKKVGDLHGAFEVIKPLDDADAMVRSTVMWGIIFVLPLLLAVLWLVQRIARQLFIQPLAEAGEICGRIAEGDLRQEIKVEGDDEVGRLMGALKRMRDQLSHLITEVRFNTDEVTRSASEIAAGNTELSSRTEQQAASLEETAASMNQMTATVQQNAGNTNRANKMISEARQRAEEGQSVSSSAIAAMNEINDASKRIENIIGVINEIAFQTNLLALNAAVEAARAGEQGRGFAVVASEVRNLAQRSAEAAAEIKGLIETSVSRVSEGSELVTKTGESLTEIAESVASVAVTIEEIAAASDEQSQGIGQVNSAVTEMDTITQQNAALVEEANASAIHLEKLAGDLLGLVGQFQTADQPAHDRMISPPTSASAPRLSQQQGQPQTQRPRPMPPKRTEAPGSGTGHEWDEF
jgi:methyl-accepting chemotaxis protein